MNTTFFLVLLFVAAYSSAYSQQEPPQQSLNHYVAFLNQSAEVVFDRFQILQSYYAATQQYRTNSSVLLRLPSSGPLEEYYYRKALETAHSGLNPQEIKQLNNEALALWQLLETFDQSGKALETYIRLKDYQRDELKKSDALLADLQKQVGQISRKRDAFYRQIQRIYRQHQPYDANDPYLKMERAMVQILNREKQTLALWPYAFNEGNRSDWPVDSIRESMLKDAELLAGFNSAATGIDYPASSMVGSFKNALQAILDLKQNAINDYTFAARQSACHGNAVYLNLINHYNIDLLSFYHEFVKYSSSAKRLLDFPSFCPVFVLESTANSSPKIARTEPFKDIPLIPFKTKLSTAPASEATFHALNAYVDFINESLRQMNHLQVQVRNYQSSAEHHRNPDPNRRRGQLTYSHADYKIPAADYQLLLGGSKSIPDIYRTSINAQTEVLMNILKEMDGLSIELITYTQEKQYEQNGLKRSDAILDRYAQLFNTFDEKKEQLYTDVRRIHESYKPANPTSSWIVSGQKLIKAIDDTKAVLFGIRSFYKGETAQLPETEKLEADRRSLITDQYKNLKGLTRYGRNNGLCPYSPYEDLAENTGRFAENVKHAKPVPAYGSHPYESFYYFYNNELVYQYNKFSELAKTGVLKTIQEPNVFAFQRLNPPKPGASSTLKTEASAPKPVVPMAEKPEPVTPKPANPAPTVAAPTLEGFASNHLILLLDVSASMDSPYKMPLLKKSIKSLLPLLRSEDQVSIVVYSGKAKIVLQPTSGTKTAEITQAIDQLRSTGETDGNDGIRTAYKLADKHFIPSGNNRIILATDGEFPISDSVYELVGQSAHKEINLTVLTFSRNEINSANLRKLATLGQGSYEHVTESKAQLQMILEAQAKKLP
ncbi:vWA domain-containing protein [Larkinella terrae]|uniref:VWA domain-containing protein n=1 Tax=Larkinella terrae TaxID=2025311 RepID=A0A7K0ELN2_9BACT|nr:VWA domain-containing protein [Larkinella terrae]MRS62719.1 VWA domain-containing protein [Larkinella terrae]